MTWTALLIVYRVVKVEWFVLKAGWYASEWVAARKAGLVVG
jgi:hypothetical protein